MRGNERDIRTGAAASTGGIFEGSLQHRTVLAIEAASTGL
jgi:hypothetical protein